MVKIKRFAVSCLLTGSLLAVFAGGVGADAAPQANCVGQQFSRAASPELGPAISGLAQTAGGLGQLAGPTASTNCGQR